MKIDVMQKGRLNQRSSAGKKVTTFVTPDCGSPLRFLPAGELRTDDHNDHASADRKWRERGPAGSGEKVEGARGDFAWQDLYSELLA